MDKPLQQFRIAEIEVSKGNTNDKIVGFFRFESPARGKPGPVLVIIAEITSTLYAYERLLDCLNQAAEQTRQLMTDVAQDPLTRFEKLVQRLNESIAAFTASEGSAVSWRRVNLFVMEFSEGHLCLSGTGHVMNMFLQKQADGSFRAFDLFGSLEQPDETDPRKPFSSIICGDMNIGDILFIGSTNFERLRSELKIKERLTSIPTVSAALEIKQDLEKRHIPDDFMAAAITCTEMKLPQPLPTPTPEVKKETSTSSIEKLVEQEKEADNHLGPSTAPTKEIIAIKDKIVTLFKKVSGLVSLPQARSSSAIKDPVTLTGLRGMNAGHGSAFKRKHKLIIGIACVAIILSISGYAYWKRAQRITAEIASWNSQFDSATDQRNRAESDLTYGNEPKAKSEIASAEQALNTLPTNTPERKAKIEKLQNEVRDLKERLKRIVKLDAAELINLPPNAAAGSLAAPVLDKDSAYAVDNATHQILKITLSTKNTKQIQLPTNAGKIISGTVGKDTILFATEDGQLFSLNKATDLVKSLTWAGVSSTADITLYASRLYSLDPVQSKIMRYTGSASEFGSGTSYIKAGSAQLNDAVAISIDSNVYVLKSSGQLVQYFQGAEAGFNLAQIDPPARSASGMWTDVDVPLIAITDPADRRVLVYDKSGQLRAQLNAPQFLAPKDIFGDYSNKRLLVVDGNRLLLVPMP
ncbi:hypothetical protein IT408_00110 [Candidatus Uhrbacteria bacterium]|nr:hypothetical protein [Candidatus Uhrbacteria bacterium]